MGNMTIKQRAEPPPEPRKKGVLIVYPLDRDYVRWLARDLERIHGYVPKNPRPIKPPDHYIEYMRLWRMLDLDLDDPDLVHLLRK